jgi:hypothetical protein
VWIRTQNYSLGIHTNTHKVALQWSSTQKYKHNSGRIKESRLDNITDLLLFLKEKFRLVGTTYERGKKPWDRCVRCQGDYSEGNSRRNGES